MTGKLLGEPAEIIKEVMDIHHAGTVLQGILEGHLQGAEKATGARKGKDHGPEQTNDLVPSLSGNAFGALRDGKRRRVLSQSS